MSSSRRDLLKSFAFVPFALRPTSSGVQATAFRGRAAGAARDVGGIRFRWCPPGEFVMGSPMTERGRRPDETQVRVALTRGFWTAQHEVTQRLWREVMGLFPDASPSATFGEGDDFPVYWVNFHEAEAFCVALTDRLRRSAALPAGWTIALPTEAQWEYACRAGTTTATAFGDTVARDRVNFNGAWDGENRTGSSERTGSYPPNTWGIHDMHGNVWEWCRDFYHPRLPGGVDPDLYAVPGTVNRDGTYSRVRRGGAWIEPGWACRSACRLRYEPDRRSDHIGFRVVAVER